MARRELSKMTPAEISALTPAQLMRYNHPLPEIDYENQNTRTEYPKMLYSLSEDCSELITAVAKDEIEEAALGEDYHTSPAYYGIDTCPAGPSIEVGTFRIKLSKAEQEQAQRAIEQEERWHAQQRDAATAT